MVGDVMAITNIIENRVKEYALVLPSEETKIFNRVDELEAWQLPPLSMVKLNVDATVNENLIVLVVVARDNSSKVLKV